MAEADDGPALGRSGARFPSARQLAKLTAEGEDAEEVPHRRRRRTVRRGRTREVGRSGARFPSASLLEKLDEDELPAPVAELPEVPEPELPELSELPEPELPVEEAIRTRVRPYVLTGGRTRTRRKLAIEALIAALPEGDRAGLAVNPETERVLALCLQPRSVAEIAALLSVPLGVAQVLIGDLEEDGRITVHATAGGSDGGPDLELMRRVLRGLHNL